MAPLVEQRDTTALPTHTAVCLGAFDGMHLGHQALVERARRLGQHVGLLTFDPHPLALLAPERAPQLLQTAEQRRRVCAALGIEHLVLLPFDRAMAQMRAEEFVMRVLVEQLRPCAVVVGEDFRFGRGREGEAGMLAELLEPAGIEVARVAAVKVPEAARVAGQDPSLKLGATAIRDAVRAGQVERAGVMLGRWHSVAGTVVHGAKRGRTIGFPTANVEAPGAFLPPVGIYASYLSVWSEDSPLSGEVWPAATSFGRNPTFEPQSPSDEAPLHLEAYVLDEDLGEQLYGLSVEVSFVARLRDELRFDEVSALIAQIERDVAQTRSRLGPSTAGRLILPPLP